MIILLMIMMTRVIIDKKLSKIAKVTSTSDCSKVAFTVTLKEFLQTNNFTSLLFTKCTQVRKIVSRGMQEPFFLGVSDCDLLPFPSPPFSLDVGPLKSSYRVWGSAVSCPSTV